MLMLAMIVKYIDIWYLVMLTMIHGSTMMVPVVLPGELVMKYLQCGAKRGGWDEI